MSCFSKIWSISGFKTECTTSRGMEAEFNIFLRRRRWARYGFSFVFHPFQSLGEKICFLFLISDDTYHKAYIIVVKFLTSKSLDIFFQCSLNVVWKDLKGCRGKKENWRLHSAWISYSALNNYFICLSVSLPLSSSHLYIPIIHVCVCITPYILLKCGVHF